MSEIQDKLAQVKQRYRQLLQDSQNPHADPVLKSIRMAIAKLEQQVNTEKPSR